MNTNLFRKLFFGPKVLYVIAVLSLLKGDIYAQPPPPASNLPVYPSYGYRPPSDWTGHRFELSQQYPTTSPAKPQFPWESINFKTNPKEYLEAVLAYCYEGFDENFDPLKNAQRRWFHAPWLHVGANGREFVNGLTRERSSRPFELWQTQDATYRNFAVGLYNELGGYTIGRVWHSPTAPNYNNVSFPEGTVSFKLLFTTATADKIPYLKSAPEWIADIDRSPSAAAVEGSKVRLLQIDIAVKDKRSNCGGWIFGTFHYDNEIGATDPWKSVRPLTLVWGNDEGLTPSLANQGQKPRESWVNEDSPITKYRRNPPQGRNPPREFGWAGRGNGPVDNPISSCLSCHSTAQQPVASMAPRTNATETEALKWFRNLAPNEPFEAGAKSLDFSLQLSMGIDNFLEANPVPVPTSLIIREAGALRISETEQELRRPKTEKPKVSRDPDEDPSRRE